MSESPEEKVDWGTQTDNVKFKMLVMALQARLGRLPTEDEIITFIFGDQEMREEIWNGAVPSSDRGPSEA